MDKWAGIATCTLPKETKCSNVKIINNIVGGAVWAGFTGLAHRCGESQTQQKFRNNVAHSVFWNLPESGHGMIIIPDSNDATGQSECAEASHNIAYKTLQGIAVGIQSGPTKMVARNMTAIDCRVGFVNAPVFRGNPSTKVLGESYNIKLFGETPLPDCPQNGNGGYCFKFEKAGYLLGSIYEKSKSVHPNMPVETPYHGWHGEASFNGQSHNFDLEFRGFKEKTAMGRPFRLVQSIDDPDFIQPSFFYNTKIIESSQQALAQFITPPDKWAIIKDCGQWPCSGPLNAMAKFINTQWSGTTSFLSSGELGGSF